MAFNQRQPLVAVPAQTFRDNLIRPQIVQANDLICVSSVSLCGSHKSPEKGASEELAES
jgi:hypothetical protein